MTAETLTRSEEELAKVIADLAADVVAKHIKEGATAEFAATRASAFILDSIEYVGRRVHDEVRAS